MTKLIPKEALNDLQREQERLFISYTDLTFAWQCARFLRERELLAREKRDNNYDLVRRAFLHALIISYCRPFTQRRDRAGEPETSDYLGQFLEKYSGEETELHEWVLQIRNQVVGHSDASMSPVDYREDLGYAVHAWFGRKPLSPDKVTMLETMIQKIRVPIAKRAEDLSAKLHKKE